jgi:hypothetical protein
MHHKRDNKLAIAPYAVRNNGDWGYCGYKSFFRQTRKNKISRLVKRSAFASASLHHAAYEPPL